MECAKVQDFDKEAFRKEYAKFIEDMKLLLKGSYINSINSPIDSIMDEYETVFWYDMVDNGLLDEETENAFEILKDMVTKAVCILREDAQLHQTA